MSLPINIDKLIHGKSVETERLEFKKGWNPEKIIHTICAFANDINNWGGGYIIIGIDEDNGQAVLPPEGVPQKDIDKIQKEVLGLAHQIQPNYFPIIDTIIFQGKHIVVLWCPAGDNRPYTAPSTQGKKSQRNSYVRIGSESIIAKGENLNRLNELSVRIPFDDRVNHQATINDLDLGIIRSYLQEINSELFKESATMPFVELCQAMNIVKGSSENILPVNVGLLFFSKEPEKFFQRSWIELVWHKDNSVKKFQEIYFKGTLQKQLRDALSFIKNNIIVENVVKHPDRAEAERFFNFPYQAIEESLSNAVYHKSYEIGSPIEIQIWEDKIEISSFPGPVPPVDAKILKTHKRIISREYRNRRIGDFFKELTLTEGRATGFPTIYETMENNGSSKPIFETDDDRTYFLTVLPVRRSINFTNGSTNESNDFSINTISDFKRYVNDLANGLTNDLANGLTNGLRKQIIELLNKELNNKVIDILKYTSLPIRRTDLFEKLGLSNQTFNRRKYIDPLVELNWIEKEIAENITTPNQVYKITNLGETVLKIIEK
jgi:ATP-dependent DNA helicase RecG